MRLRIVVGCLSPVLLLLGGCANGDVSKVVPVSGGKTIVVPLTRDGLKPGEAEGYVASIASLKPGKETRSAFYTFGVTTSHAPDLRRIRVVDISDETESPLIDDQNPKFEHSAWMAHTADISADDPRMQWIFQITGSMRVYQFILTTNEGRDITFHHVVVYPPALKMIMRSGWGEKY